MIIVSAIFAVLIKMNRFTVGPFRHTKGPKHIGQGKRGTA